MEADDKEAIPNVILKNLSVIDSQEEFSPPKVLKHAICSTFMNIVGGEAKEFNHQSFVYTVRSFCL